MTLNLVREKSYLECGKCIWCNIKGWHLNVLEKVEELLGVQHDFRQSFIASALAQHCAAIEGDLLVLIASHQREENLRFCADVFDGRWAGADLSSKYIVEHLRDILLALEINSIKVLDEQEEQITVVQFLS